MQNANPNQSKLFSKLLIKAFLMQDTSPNQSKELPENWLKLKENLNQNPPKIKNPYMRDKSKLMQGYLNKLEQRYLDNN